MGDGLRRRRYVITAAVILVPLLILAAWGLAFAGSVGMLPWQPEPTRIAITPFADLPSMNGLATPSP